MLTPEQFRQIGLYIAGKGIPYYDVQTEFADHLGELVQNAMQERGIGFIEALGEQGPIFSQDWPLIVEYKTMYARKKILDAVWTEVIRFFSWPMIGITLPLIAAHIFLATSRGWINNFPLVAQGILFATGKYIRRRSRDVEQRDLFDLDLRRDFLLGRQVGRFHLYLRRFEWGSYFFLLADMYLWSPGYHLPPVPPTLLNEIIYYSFPCVMLLRLAWQRASLHIYKTLIKDYPTTLSEEDQSLKEILDGLKQQH
jgi:hypothetical protein